MNVIRRCGWEISDRLATPEHLVFSRRNFLTGGASALAMTPYAAQAQRVSDAAKLPDPSADLYPAKRNEKYTLDRPITDEKVNGNYNNFYEFGTSKTVAVAAQALPIRPWTVKIDGMVEKPMDVGIDELIQKLTLEERTRVWYSVQRPYRLSLYYEVRVVNLDSETSEQRRVVDNRSVDYSAGAVVS